MVWGRLTVAYWRDYWANIANVCAEGGGCRAVFFVINNKLLQSWCIAALLRYVVRVHAWNGASLCGRCGGEWCLQRTCRFSQLFRVDCYLHDGTRLCVWVSGVFRHHQRRFCRLMWLWATSFNRGGALIVQFRVALLWIWDRIIFSLSALRAFIAFHAFRVLNGGKTAE